MKKNIATIILIFVLLLLALIYYFVNNSNFFIHEENVFKLKNNDVIEYEVNINNTNLKFIKQNNLWLYDINKNIKLNQKKFIVIESVLSNLKFSRNIGKFSKDLNEFGLVKPYIKIFVKTNKNYFEALFIGNMTSSKSEYYVKRENSNNIYLIKKGDIDGFVGDLSFYRDKSLINIDKELITLFEINNPTGEKYKFLKNNNKWQLVIPVTAELKNDLINDLINKIINIQIIDFINLNQENINKYELNKFKYQIILGDNKKNLQIINFGKNENKQVYVTISGKEEIFLISQNDFNSDDLKVGELLNESPLSISIDKVEKIIIKDRNEIIELIKNKDGSNFLKNNKEVNNKEFISLFVNIMSLKADGIEIREYLKPEFSISFMLKESSQNLTVDFVKRNNDSYYMYINKKQGKFYINSIKIEEIRKWLKRI